MMDCRAVQQNIDLHIDGMLDEREALQLERHVEVCSACKKALDDALRLKRALASLPDLEPPAGAAAAVVLVAVLSSGISDFGDATSMPAEEMAADEAGEEVIMFSAEAPEEPMAMEDAAAPEEARAAGDMMMQGESEDMDSSRAYDKEQDFGADFVQRYYKPAVLPEGAVLETIEDSDSSVVFIYVLSGGDAYYFEWLTGVPQGGLEDELNYLYGSADLFDKDNQYYIRHEADMSIVYWEQDGQVFRVIAPVSVADITAYCLAQEAQ